MAYSPQKKAAAIADLIAGMSYAEVAKKHKIAKATINDWATKTERKPNENEQKQTAVQNRKDNEFDAALKRYLLSTIGMLQAWATECSDPAFIRANPQGVHELGESVLDRAERILSSIREDQQPASEAVEQRSPKLP